MSDQKTDTMQLIKEAVDDGDQVFLIEDVEVLLAEIEGLERSVRYRDARLVTAREEIERLQGQFNLALRKNDEQWAEIERLKAVVDAVKDIKWRSIDKDNMEFATTCFVVDRIREALAALEIAGREDGVVAVDEAEARDGEGSHAILDKYYSNQSSIANKLLMAQMQKLSR